MVKEPMCEHCRYKRFTCSWFRCDPYKEAKLKHKARWYQNAFPIEDYDAEDRYVTGVILKYIVVIGIFLTGVYSILKAIGEWIL